MSKELLINQKAVSYFFRTKEKKSHSSSVDNFPVHTLTPNIPNIPNISMLSEDEQKHSEVVPVFPFALIGDKFLIPLKNKQGQVLFPVLSDNNKERFLAMRALDKCLYEPDTYKLLQFVLPDAWFPEALNKIVLGYLNHDQDNWTDWIKRDHSVQYHFPWENDKEFQRLTEVFIMQDVFTPDQRIKTTQKMIKNNYPHTLTHLDEARERHGFVKRYMQHATEEIENFLISVMLNTYDYSYPMYGIVIKARIAIHSIRQDMGFPCYKDLDYYPPEKSLSVLADIFASTSFNYSFFEHIIACPMGVKKRQIYKVFYMARSLLECALIPSATAPQSAVFHMTIDIEQALYAHVKRLGLYHLLEVKGTGNTRIEFHNSESRLVLLNKTLEVLKEKIPHIEGADDKGFFVTPANRIDGIRLFNYLKRSKILDILCGYINDWKGSVSKNYVTEANALMERILNTPLSDSRLNLVIIDDIQKFLSSGELNSTKNYLWYAIAMRKVLNHLEEELSDQNEFEEVYQWLTNETSTAASVTAVSPQEELKTDSTLRSINLNNASNTPPPLPSPQTPHLGKTRDNIPPSIDAEGAISGVKAWQTLKIEYVKKRAERSLGEYISFWGRLGWTSHSFTAKKAALDRMIEIADGTEYKPEDCRKLAPLFYGELQKAVNSEKLAEILTKLTEASKSESDVTSFCW